MGFKERFKEASYQGLNTVAESFQNSIQNTLDNQNIEKFAELCMMNLLEAGIERRKAVKLMEKRWNLNRFYLIELGKRVEQIVLPTQLLGEYMEEEGYTSDEIFSIIREVDLENYLANRTVPKKFSAEQLYNELKKKFNF